MNPPNEAPSDSITWLLDSGCSDHIVNDKRYFAKYIELTTNVNIKVGDGHLIKALGIGTVEMNCIVDKEFSTVSIKNCYYAPNMSQNLLSVSKITDFGNKLWTEKEHCEIFNQNNKKIAIALKSKNLYVLTGYVITDNIKSFACNSLTLKEKWHRTLGHVNFRDLTVMCRDQLAKGLPQSIENINLKCETCFISKMSNLKFDHNRTRANRIAEIIHTDVNGPIKQVGFNGERYFVSFIDDFSRIAVVYCIKSKNEVFDCFEKYVNRIENQSDSKIKEIRCDRGTEYLNRKFYSFAKNKGIWLRPSPAYTHELNGMAERYNRTIMDRARCLLNEGNLEKKFWPECIKTAAYLGNRVIANNKFKLTPYELFFGRKPNISNLKMYGSTAFVRIPEVNRESKLSPKSMKGTLVGYDDMGYRILVDQQIIVSRHVEFIEKNEGFVRIPSNEFENTDNETNTPKEDEKNETEEEDLVTEDSHEKKQRRIRH